MAKAIPTLLIAIMLIVGMVNTAAVQRELDRRKLMIEENRKWRSQVEERLNQVEYQLHKSAHMGGG